MWYYIIMPLKDMWYSVYVAEVYIPLIRENESL